MNDSTKDSQELIKDLGKAGGGLSSGRAFFLRYPLPYQLDTQTFERMREGKM